MQIMTPVYTDTGFPPGPMNLAPPDWNPNPPQAGEHEPRVHPPLQHAAPPKNAPQNNAPQNPSILNIARTTVPPNAPSPIMPVTNPVSHIHNALPQPHNPVSVPLPHVQNLPQDPQPANLSNQSQTPAGPGSPRSEFAGTDQDEDMDGNHEEGRKRKSRRRVAMSVSSENDSDADDEADEEDLVRSFY